jgi:hypothetical protein
MRNLGAQNCPAEYGHPGKMTAQNYPRKFPQRDKYRRRLARAGARAGFFDAHPILASHIKLPSVK